MIKLPGEIEKLIKRRFKHQESFKGMFHHLDNVHDGINPMGKNHQQALLKLEEDGKPRMFGPANDIDFIDEHTSSWELLFRLYPDVIKNLSIIYIDKQRFVKSNGGKLINISEKPADDKYLKPAKVTWDKDPNLSIIHEEQEKDPELWNWAYFKQKFAPNSEDGGKEIINKHHPARDAFSLGNIDFPYHSSEAVDSATSSIGLQEHFKTGATAAAVAAAPGAPDSAAAVAAAADGQVRVKSNFALYDADEKVFDAFKLHFEKTKALLETPTTSKWVEAENLLNKIGEILQGPPAPPPPHSKKFLFANKMWNYILLNLLVETFGKKLLHKETKPERPNNTKLSALYGFLESVHILSEFVLYFTADSPPKIKICTIKDHDEAGTENDLLKESVDFIISQTGCVNLLLNPDNWTNFSSYINFGESKRNVEARNSGEKKQITICLNFIKKKVFEEICTSPNAKMYSSASEPASAA